MVDTILTFKDVILILQKEGTLLIMGDATYLIDGEYREKVSLSDLEGLDNLQDGIFSI
jgi:hypothetical protein